MPPREIIPKPPSFLLKAPSPRVPNGEMDPHQGEKEIPKVSPSSPQGFRILGGPWKKAPGTLPCVSLCPKKGWESNTSFFGANKNLPKGPEILFPPDWPPRPLCPRVGSPWPKIWGPKTLFPRPNCVGSCPFRLGQFLGKWENPTPGLAPRTPLGGKTRKCVPKHLGNCPTQWE